jgi:hypothetical protein
MWPTHLSSSGGIAVLLADQVAVVLEGENRLRSGSQ